MGERQGGHDSSHPDWSLVAVGFLHLKGQLWLPLFTHTLFLILSLFTLSTHTEVKFTPDGERVTSVQRDFSTLYCVSSKTFPDVNL